MLKKGEGGSGGLESLLTTEMLKNIMKFNFSFFLLQNFGPRLVSFGLN